MKPPKNRPPLKYCIPIFASAFPFSHIFSFFQIKSQLSSATAQQQQQQHQQHLLHATQYTSTQNMIFFNNISFCKIYSITSQITAANTCYIRILIIKNKQIICIFHYIYLRENTSLFILSEYIYTYHNICVSEYAYIL